MINKKSDIKLFEDLRKSDLGKELGEYLERLNSHLCDIRNWEGYTFDEIKALEKASKVIEIHLADKLKYKNDKKGKLPQFE